MKYSDIFKKRLGCADTDEVFKYLLDHMKRFFCCLGKGNE
jgi:type II restriction enzyme